MLDNLDQDLCFEPTTYQSQMEAPMPSLRSCTPNGSACTNAQALRHLRISAVRSKRQALENKLTTIALPLCWAAASKGFLVKKMVSYMHPRGFTMQVNYRTLTLRYSVGARRKETELFAC